MRARSLYPTSVCIRFGCVCVSSEWESYFKQCCDTEFFVDSLSSFVSITTIYTCRRVPFQFLFTTNTFIHVANTRAHTRLHAHKHIHTQREFNKNHIDFNSVDVVFCIHCNSAALHTPITMHAFSKQHMQVLQTQRKSNTSKRRMHSSGRNVLNIQLRLLISIPILPPFFRKHSRLGWRLTCMSVHVTHFENKKVFITSVI